MRRRRETVEHPFGTLKMRMGATHFLMKTLPKVASEMALSVLAYNLTRVAALWADRGRADDAKALLQPVLDQFVEGFNTPDLKAAERLLATLR